MTLLVLLLLLLLIYVNNASGKLKRFAYEPGCCDITITSVLEDTLRSEMRAIFDPTLRVPNGHKELKYDLYTRYNPDQRQMLRVGDELSLSRSHFNASWPVRISVHGWAGKSTSCSNAAIKDAYLQRGNFNVIIVDWSAYALDVSYRRISKQMAAIAANLLEFIHFLHKTRGVAYGDIHVIGHSAGAHIAGLAGKQLNRATRKEQQHHQQQQQHHKLGAIYALDPAGLTQRRWSAEQRLAPNDAAYVESVHSDTTLLGNPSMALSQVTFLANWGQGQPHCLNVSAAEFDFSCDHFGALYYFAESVRQSRAFGAIQCTQKPTASTNSSAAGMNCRCNDGTTKCNAQVFMGGEPLVAKPHGIYYFSTAKQQPYGRGNEVLVKPTIMPTFMRSRVSRLYQFIRI